MGISSVTGIFTAACRVKTVPVCGEVKSTAPAGDTAVFSEEAQKAAAEQTDSNKAEESPKSFSEMIKEQTDKINSMFSSKQDEINRQTLSAIRMKMRGGLTLSASEEQFLSQNDKTAYENYNTIRSARQQFRCQLYCARSKDEVNGMRLSNALTALAAYKKAVRGGGDGNEVAGLNMALEREISDFAKSGKYNSLPTSAERGKYYMELAKARKFEREKQLAKKLNAKRRKKIKVKQPGDGKRTVAQVENSALGKKVRAADKPSACCFSCPSPVKVSYSKMNQKG